MDAEEHRPSSDEREQVETLLDALESVHDHSVLCPTLHVPVEDIMRDVLQDP